jgi:hypothetical protein
MIDHDIEQRRRRADTVATRTGVETMTKLGVISVVLGAASVALAGPDEDRAAARAQAIQQAREAGLIGTRVQGDKAMILVRAIKFAGVKPTTASQVRTFKVKAIHCWSTKEGADLELGDSKCSLDKREVKDGLAFLLQTAMESAGIASDDHMSQHTTDAKAVTCEIDPAKTGEGRFECVYSTERP